MQMELDKAQRARSAQMADQSTDSQEELERLMKAQDELAARQEALNRIGERRDNLILSRKEALYRLKRSIEELEKEKGYMSDELNDLEQISECFIKRFKELEYLDPEEWDRQHLNSYMDKTEKLLENIDKDFSDAIAHCLQRMQRTKMFGEQKVGKHSFFGANLKEVFLQGLVYNLPLILLGVLALMVYIFKS